MDYSTEGSPERPWLKWVLIGGGTLVGIAVIVVVVMVLRSRAMTEETAPPIAGVGAPASPSAPAGGQGTGATPPPQAVKICGDGFCDYPKEDDVNCPSDCRDAKPEVLFVGYTQTGVDAIQLEWRTNVPTSDVVDYGDNDKYELGQLKEETPSFTHSVTIQNAALKPGRAFFYRITAKDAKGREVIYASSAELAGKMIQ